MPFSGKVAASEAHGEELAQFENGIMVFSRLFTRWMDMNEWSHPVMVTLAKSCLHGTSWLHSSQISGLRHGRLRSPGPRTFVALERLNFYLNRYATNKTLLPGTKSSAPYSNPYVILEDGQPPSLGWWVEVFCGTITPKDIDLKLNMFTDFKAKIISERWGKLIRTLLAANGVDIIVELDTAVLRYYPAGDDHRVAKILEVIRAQSTWTPSELSNEIPALTQMTSALGGPSTEDDLLAELN